MPSIEWLAKDGDCFLRVCVVVVGGKREREREREAEVEGGMAL